MGEGGGVNCGVVYFCVLLAAFGSPKKCFCRESCSRKAGKKISGKALSIARNSSKSMSPSEFLNNICFAQKNKSGGTAVELD